MKKFIAISIIICTTFFANFVYAGENVPFSYNVIPEIKNEYVIDSNHTDHIEFTLFEDENAIYVNDNLLDVEDNRFSISIDGLTGKQSFKLSNDKGEEVTYTYFISDEKGYLDGFNFDELKKSYKTYVKTVKGITLIYTSKDAKIISKVEKIIEELPDEILSNTRELRFLPTTHSSKAAGITKYNKITFYNLSSYSSSTLKNVVIHEIAHTWAHDLTKDKIIDFSYTDYKSIVNSEKNFPSKYAKLNVQEGNYSEDFAESVSFFFINEKNFTKKFPERASYISEILSIKTDLELVS